EKNIVRLNEQSVFDHSEADDVGLHDATKPLFAGSKSILDTPTGRDVARNHGQTAVRVGIRAVFKPPIEWRVKMFEAPGRALGYGIGDVVMKGFICRFQNLRSLFVCESNLSVGI